MSISATQGGHKKIHTYRIRLAHKYLPFEPFEPPAQRNCCRITSRLRSRCEFLSGPDKTVFKHSEHVQFLNFQSATVVYCRTFNSHRGVGGAISNH